MSEADQGKAQARVLLDIAAIYATSSGTSSALAHALGVNPTAILQARSRGKVSAELAVKIESLLGRALFPRELFRPDLFLIGD
ncbi:MAG TPA: hypothetical protein VK181_16625 [Rhizobium sp.]|nr:hypothetical protein [Rhizobium sp.]